MKRAELQVVEAGLGVTVQDLSRAGWRASGVPLAGALDPSLMAAANALVGNPIDAAVLEIGPLGPTLQATMAPVQVALAGRLSGTVHRVDGSVHTLEAWRSATLLAGDRLRVLGATRGVAYLAVSGGLCTPPQLGSRATYRRAALGGVQGRSLAVNDTLPCAPTAGSSAQERRAREPWGHAAGPIRVIAGPQEDHFSPEAQAVFTATAWRVTRDFDRMGVRLEGPPLEHNARGADIHSDGVVPGAIQVPGNGQPIVLLADGQTTGGYAKIATVIRADLPRLAHLVPGDELFFAHVNHEQANAALRDSIARFGAWLQSLETFLPAGFIDEAALFQANIISGLLRGDEPFADALA